MAPRLRPWVLVTAARGAREVIELVRMIQDRVREKFGIELQPEPNFIGFDSGPIDRKRA